MTSTTNAQHEAITEYLGSLERALKQTVGVRVEDALADAREHLVQDAQALLRSEPTMTDIQVYQHILATFGQPDQVARHYEDSATPNLLKLKGYAPGWRICCTRCGRSAPAAKAGITRMGAFSRHKYVVGWCHDCRWLRWMRIQKDLDATNLTASLGVSESAAAVHRDHHRPWTILLTILVSVLTILLIVGSVLAALAFTLRS